MMRRSLAIGALLVSILCLAMPGMAMAQDARAFVGTLGQEAIQVLGPSIPAAQREASSR